MDKVDKRKGSRTIEQRLSLAIGHLNGIKKMIEDGRDYQEIFDQLLGVRAEVTNAAKVILKERIDGYVSDMENGDSPSDIESFKKVVDQLVQIR
jgi:DNA-binding FrmR family transcriptional regulator